MIVMVMHVAIGTGRAIAELRDLVSPAGSPDNELGLEIDGAPILSAGDKLELHDFRTVSDLFDYSFPADNIGGQPAGVYYPTVGDGYYIMLKPLSPGSHTVRITSTIPASGFALDVTYHLEVVNLAGLCVSLPVRSVSCWRRGRIPRRHCR